MPRNRWIQCHCCGKLRTPEEHSTHINHVKYGEGSMILPDIEPFVSTVDGSVIGSRSKLRAHNKRHGVIQMSDWGNEGEIKEKERKKVFKPGSPERVEDIRRAIYERGGDY